MAFRKGEVLHVVDTLYKGVVGAWQAFRVGKNRTRSHWHRRRHRSWMVNVISLLSFCFGCPGPNGQDLQQGVIANSATAEELATAQFNAAKKEATSQVKPFVDLSNTILPWSDLFVLLDSQTNGWTLSLNHWSEPDTPGSTCTIENKRASIGGGEIEAERVSHPYT